MIRPSVRMHRSMRQRNEVREQIGSERPVYLGFDVDGLDPSVAPEPGNRVG